MIKEDQIIFISSFSCSKNCHGLIKSKSICIAYETVADEKEDFISQ